MRETKLDFFHRPYFSDSELLMSAIGAWPLQDFWVARRRVFFCTIIMISHLVLEAKRLSDVWFDVMKVFSILPPLIVRAICFVKWYNVVFQRRTGQMLLLLLQADWESSMTVEERNVMESYGELGRKMIAYYIRYMYTSMVIYMLTPLCPVFLDILSPLNESRQRKLLFEAEYFVDEDKYYYHIQFYSIITTTVYITVLIAVDTIYVLYGNHACSRFSVVCCRLENTIELLAVGKENNDFARSANIYRHVVITIKHHKEAMKYTKFIEDSFKTSMLLQVSLCIITMSITGVLAVINEGNKDDVMRYGSFALAQACHLFFLNFPGQRVTNHSNQVFQSTYASCWHDYSMRTKQLIRLLLLRSIMPCYFTAGKICTLSMETYLAIMKTCMSYFTVLSSM